MISQAWLAEARQRAPLQAVQEESASLGASVWLVGGAVRQAVLGQAWSDLDFAVQGDAMALARRVAKRVGFSYVPLDEARRIARIVPPHQGLGMDFASLVGSSLTADLMQRDLTVNAMAIPLASLIADETPELIDPCGGLPDMESRLVRVPAESVLIDDPLRLVRVFRFAAQLGFEVDPTTNSLLSRHAGRLSSVSPERVRDELFKILKVKAAAPCIRRLDATGLLEVIFPSVRPMRGLMQGGHHHADVMEHSLVTLEEIEQRAWDEPEVAAWLAQPLVDGRTKGDLLKLVALLHDVGKPGVAEPREGGGFSFPGHDAAGARVIREIAEALRLSNREVRSAERLVAAHLLPLELAEALPPSDLATIFGRAADDSVGSLLLAAADSYAARGPKNPPETRAATEAKLHRCLPFLARWDAAGAAPLLRGDEVASLLSLTGPAIAEALTRLRTAHMSGSVATPDEARAWLLQ